MLIKKQISNRGEIRGMSYKATATKTSRVIRNIIETQENKQSSKIVNTLESQLLKYNKHRGAGVLNVCNNKKQD